MKHSEIVDSTQKNNLAMILIWLKSSHRLLRERKKNIRGLIDEEFIIFLKGQISAYRNMAAYIIDHNQRYRSFRWFG